MDRVLTLDELAELLHVHRATLDRWRRAGRLPIGRKVGRRWLFTESEVFRWLESLSGQSNAGRTARR